MSEAQHLESCKDGKSPFIFLFISNDLFKKVFELALCAPPNQKSIASIQGTCRISHSKNNVTRTMFSTYTNAVRWGTLGYCLLNLPIRWINYYGPRIHQVRRDKSSSVAAIQHSYFNGVKPRVRPVNVPSQPVHRNSCQR